MVLAGDCLAKHILRGSASAGGGAAYIPMEITNIKPSGTGSPAIPSTNRIFKAYPGIEYNIRVAVLGGLYPFTYSLSNAPSGMTINSRTGEISWPNPQSSANSIVVSVTDSENTTVNSSWSITVTTDGFKFVSAEGANGTGTISNPYNSISNMFAGANQSDIIYFRGGTHQYNGGAHWHFYAHQYIGYPGEQAVIDMNKNILAPLSPAYYDNLTFIDMQHFGNLIGGDFSYNTIRRCTYDGFMNISSDYDNQGVISVSGAYEQGYYTVIQDNEIKNFGTSNGGPASAIGSIYATAKLVVENNYIHSNTTGGLIRGIRTKVYAHTFSIRGNKIIMSQGYPVYTGPGERLNGNEFAFNLIVRTGQRAGDESVMQAYEWIQGNTLFYRNTIIADVLIRNCASGEGPWSFNNNIISNPNTTSENFEAITNFIAHNEGSSCFQVSNQLSSTNASSLVNSDDEYKLVPGQSSYVGSRGWQLSDGLTPMELSGAP